MSKVDLIDQQNFYFIASLSASASLNLRESFLLLLVNVK